VRVSTGPVRIATEYNPTWNLRVSAELINWSNHSPSNRKVGGPTVPRFEIMGETNFLATYFVHEPMAAGIVRANLCVERLVD
jgi:hypothetical protein